MRRIFITDEVSADDLLGHGTMVSGIIAGSGAASGGKYRGIAPGANLLNVKVIDSKGDGKVSDIIAGIEWAHLQRCRCPEPELGRHKSG